MFIPTNVVCYLNANFCSNRNGNELPIPSSPESFCAVVAVSAGADTRTEAAPRSSSLPFPGFPGLAAPPPVVQPPVASIEPPPALHTPSEAFFRAGRAAGLRKAAAPHLCSRSNATKRLRARTDLELIWVTG